MAAEVADEGDLGQKVPSENRQLSVWIRKTRQNKIRKVVREVYLRDDLYPELFDGAEQILILDTNVVLHQMDFVMEDDCVNHVVVPYTVLNAVRQRHMGTYSRLRGLCRSDLEDKKAQETLTKRRRDFYVFPNEYFRETYVEREPEETTVERNDRAIRRVAHWYKRHVDGVDVLFVTDDEKCKAKAKEDGLDAVTAHELADRMRTRGFPNAGEKLAARAADLIMHEVGEEGADKKDETNEDAATRKRKREEQVQKDKDAYYLPHLRASEVTRGLKEKWLCQGSLRMHMNTCVHGTVFVGTTAEGKEIEISGRQHMNRSCDGDIVAVQILESGASEPADKKLKTDDFGSAGGAQTAGELMQENAMDIDRKASTTSGKLYGRVVGIIKRNWREYCGTLRPPHEDRKKEFGESNFNKAERIFIPADPRIPNIILSTRHSTNLENKRIVVTMDSWDRWSRNPRGHWTRILGDVGDRSVESAVILHEHGVITREFGEAVLRCLPPADFTPSAEEIAKRVDMRNVLVCSIDPPGCKDIDDALSCESLPNGNFRVGCHIADVTHFVKPGTAIDIEASERCTTVYLVEKRTDMLPGLLTTDLCSLVANVDRLTFSVLWEMTPQAEIVDTKFCKAIIRSCTAFSYAEAQAKIDDPTDKEPITVSMRNLLKIARHLNTKRKENGALELASQEVKFELDSETQDPLDVAEYKSRETNKLIEEFMLLGNQSVAQQILAHFPQFAVLRRHPPPKDQALKQLKALLEKNGFDEFEYGSNKELAQSLDASVKNDDAYFNTLVRIMATRCMNQAVYFCTGELEEQLYDHYGLAMSRYTHFTSPIRRYADVLVHRLLAASIGLGALPEEMQSKDKIKGYCDVINVRNRAAQFAGRASADLHTYMYFNKMGEQLAEGIVTRVRKSGVNVTVPRYGIEGAVDLKNEEWEIDGEEAIVRSKVNPGEQFTIFDHIKVRIASDNKDFRNRTILVFEGFIHKEDAKPFKIGPEQSKIQREMFPDRLVREAN